MMPSVYLSSPTNSTLFTTCCDVAINDDQKFCPICAQEIEEQTHRERWNKAYRLSKTSHGNYRGRMDRPK